MFIPNNQSQPFGVFYCGNPGARGTNKAWAAAKENAEAAESFRNNQNVQSSREILQILACRANRRYLAGTDNIFPGIEFRSTSQSPALSLRVGNCSSS